MHLLPPLHGLLVLLSHFYLEYQSTRYHSHPPCCRNPSQSSRHLDQSTLKLRRPCREQIKACREDEDKYSIASANDCLQNSLEAWRLSQSSFHCVQTHRGNCDNRQCRLFDLVPKLKPQQASSVLIVKSFPIQHASAKLVKRPNALKPHLDADM